ncbi:MAG: nitrate/nitrite transporter NrtS [Stenomitos rutilans HA7619-LM2]|nr:nitrate/nitrite transporter NrtS [Stenomitos rutilans HA7619-LM2]
MIRGYILSLFDPEFVTTGVKTAVFVGSLLFAINHGLALLRNEMTVDRWISVAATYAMPYLVNVYGQYSYRRKLSKQPSPLLSEAGKARLPQSRERTMK